MGIGAPRATPPRIVETLSREIRAALGDPSLKTKLDDLGSSKQQLPLAEFEQRIADDVRKWSEVIGYAGLKPRKE